MRDSILKITLWALTLMPVRLPEKWVVCIWLYGALQEFSSKIKLNKYSNSASWNYRVRFSPPNLMYLLSKDFKDLPAWPLIGTSKPFLCLESPSGRSRQRVLRGTQSGRSSHPKTKENNFINILLFQMFLYWFFFANCTCDSTSIAMSMNMSWSSLMEDSSLMISAWRASMSASVCLAAAVSIIIPWKHTKTKNEMKNSGLELRKELQDSTGHRRCVSEFTALPRFW